MDAQKGSHGCAENQKEGGRENEGFGGQELKSTMFRSAFAK